MDPLVITAAVVGGELSRDDTPHLPLSPQEIAEEAVQCAQAGARIIHLHARDSQGQPKHDPRLFGEIVTEIQSRSKGKRQTCPLLQFSTGGSVGMTVEERVAPLSCLPDMATLTTGSVNFGKEVFFNDEQTIVSIAQALTSKGIPMEIEIFDYFLAGGRGRPQQGAESEHHGCLCGNPHNTISSVGSHHVCTPFHSSDSLSSAGFASSY